MTTQASLLAGLTPLARRAGVSIPKRLLVRDTPAFIAAITAGVAAAGGLYGRNPDRPDGFNPLYDLRANPDVLAAGVNPYDHWQRYGISEGRLPYEGATAGPLPVSSAIYRQTPPEVYMPDVYAEPGAEWATVRVQLLHNGEPDSRSFTWAFAGGANDPAFGRLGYGDYLETVHDARPFLPSSDCYKEFRVRIGHPHAVGSFKFFLGGPADFPRIEAACRIHLNTPRPADLPPERFVRRTLAPVTCPSAEGGFYTDFLGDLSADWAEVGGGDLNGMQGAFAKPGARKASGALVDCYPIIDGVRHLMPVDCRDDAFPHKGGGVPWAMPKLFSGPAFAGPYGAWELDSTLPERCNPLNFAFWGIKPDGSWPPEIDHFEYRGHGADTTIHSNDPWQSKVTQLARFPVPLTGRHVVTVERTPDWYRIFVDRVLVVEMPNYLGSTPIGTTICIEGPGGAAAGPYEPDTNYTLSPWKLHSFRYRELAA